MSDKKQHKHKEHDDHKKHHHDDEHKDKEKNAKGLLGIVKKFLK